ncbi:UPF0481 protein At3g47200-like [Corylus avellana]|uniref:UPF0481 protein At3g47200-like n=1 Tax=Corylus avellana TaxID=13451 RepID=UPI00286C1C56|nr:UPF0481 protein At3g47200-like [Corylus avellana]
MACQDVTHVQKKNPKCKELVIDIPYVLEPPAWPQCCIYRVPKKLRKVNQEAYTPKLISIGPLHNYCRQEFREMEMQKVRYLREFCFRTGRSQDDLASIIEKKEIEIRHCYAETSTLSSKEFVNMILLDGIFILELFLRTSEKKEHEKKEMEKKEHERKEYEDYILSKPWLRDGIQHDLLLLENQLPYFVLKDLYESGAEGQQMIKKVHKEDLKTVLKDIPFLKLCRKYFSKYDRQPDTNIVIGKVIKHFTDLLRYFFYPSHLEEKEKRAIDRLCSATKLDEAGVKFKEVKERHLLDIQFQKDKCLEQCPYLNCSWLLNCLPCLKCIFFLEHMQPFLELPAFVVNHETDCVFRNIMALEQCHYPTEAYICNYILLLDCLINTEKDVDLLVDKKVIVNQLGNDEALARLVNKLGHQIVAEDSCYYELCQTLNKHYDNFWNRNMATLTTTYFRDIWRGTATVVGIIFLLLTFWNIFLRHFVKMPNSSSRSGN